MDKDELHDFLFPPIPGYFGYHVHRFKVPGGHSIRHYPTACEGKLNSEPRDHTGVDMIGFRGLMVRDEASWIGEYPVLLAWVGLDIDAEHNPHVDKLPERVAEVVCDKGTVRTSKSGAGAHVFFRIAGQPKLPYEEAKRVARRFAAGAEDRLYTKAGIVCCVTGLPNLWVWSEGGRQREVRVCKEWNLPPEGSYVLRGEKPAAPVSGTGLAQYSPMIQAILKILHVANVLDVNNLAPKTQVNIGKVKRALAGHLDFATKSKCRPEYEHEINGFIQLDAANGSFALVSNADNGSVLQLVS